MAGCQSPHAAGYVSHPFLQRCPLLWDEPLPYTVTRFAGFTDAYGMGADFAAAVESQFKKMIEHATRSAVAAGVVA